MTDVIRLAGGGVECVVAPALGGSILRLALDGIDLLRPAPDDARDILAVASFPLLPFANRIGHGRLHHGGIDATLDVDPIGAPHAIHGHGWRAAWRVIAAEAAQVTLSYDHHGQGWPWPYRAEQRIALADRGIVVEIAIENRHPSASMPAGAGLHPYFTRAADSRIVAHAAHMWRNDDTGLAIAPVADDRLDGVHRVPVDRFAGDDNWFDAAGGVVVESGGHAVRIDGELVAGLHIYVPDGEDHFCVEPTSHAPDSFGRGEIGDGDIIAPGGQRRWTFRIVAGEGEHRP